MSSLHRYCLLILLAVLSQFELLGQVDSTLDNTYGEDSSGVLITRAEKVIYSLTDDGQEIDTLKREVVLIQDSLYMGCNYAVVTDQIHAYATGDIVIIHKDSTVIYADTLRYNGLLKIAVVTGEVILDSKGKRLNTDRLVYNIAEETASFNTGGKLIDDQTTLDALAGVYDLTTEVALFKTNVSYEDTSMIVLADSIQYNYLRNQIRFLGPTNIIQDSTTIYTESGVYNTETDQAVLSDNVQIETDNRIIRSELLLYDGNTSIYQMFFNPSITQEDGSVAQGDTIIYDGHKEILTLIGDANYLSEDQNVDADEIIYNLQDETYQTKGKSQVSDDGATIEADTILKANDGNTEAFGSVTLRDTSAGSTIICDRVISSEQQNKAFSMDGQPLLIYELGEGDSLRLLADTLVSITIDTGDIFIAQDDVSLQIGDITGRANSLVYYKSDSIFVLYDNPILWSDSTQLTADTIIIRLVENKITDLDLISHAYIIEQDAVESYNQVNGDQIDCKISDQSLDHAEVISSAQMIYFIRDENEDLKGVNMTLSSSMLFDFEENEIETIRFFKKPESEITEYQSGMQLSNFLLDGFEWRIQDKPLLSNFALLKK